MKLLPLFLMLACSGGKESGDGTTDSNGGGTGSTDSGPGDDVKPQILSVDSATCNTFTGSDPPEDSWTFLLTVNDPQGADTVRTGTAEAKKGNTLVGSFDIPCRNGSCITSSRSSLDGITCDFDGTFNFQVSDTDGNPSDVLVQDAQ